MLGTLIGNWFEEECLREKTGEGRSLPGKHMMKTSEQLFEPVGKDYKPNRPIETNTFNRTLTGVEVPLPHSSNYEYGTYVDRVGQLPKTGFRHQLIEKQVKIILILFSSIFENLVY